MIRPSKVSKIRGFTIVELMIASTVLAVLLLIIATALIQMSRIYQKGIVKSQTQEVARRISATIAESIQFTTGNIQPGLTPAAGSQGFCVGNRIFSYLPSRQLTEGIPSATQTRVGFIVADRSGCPAVADDLLAKSLPLPSGEFELLATNTSVRVEQPQLVAGTDDLYTFAVTVSYGPMDLIDLANGECFGGSEDSHLCASSRLETTVKRRIKE